jgi:trans-2,3-dihydro-3-hydroxyanthranilate isomerase
VEFTIVNACLRDGAGGSPTAVGWDRELSDSDRRRIPRAAGTSHAVFVSADGSVRFFTAEAELPACGHGTVAALAFLAENSGREQYRATLTTPERSFEGEVHRAELGYFAGFDPGEVALREAGSSERAVIAEALGIDCSEAWVGSVGRSRLLVQAPDAEAVRGLSPDYGQLRRGCDAIDALGVYAFSPPGPDGRLHARMFAPSIGVPEDIANANSTACLMALLARRGLTQISVEMGDALGTPSTILAQAQARIRVGGFARIAGEAAVAIRSG